MDAGRTPKNYIFFMRKNCSYFCCFFFFVNFDDCCNGVAHTIYDASLVVLNFVSFQVHTKEVSQSLKYQYKNFANL